MTAGLSPRSAAARSAAAAESGGLLH
jgi:hypothetical protein